MRLRIRCLGNEYYVYMIGHMAKHLKYGGIGIRMLLDLFVFAQKKKDSCDWKKVEAYLERGRLLKFSETMQRFLQQCMEEDESFFEGKYSFGTYHWQWGIRHDGKSYGSETLKRGREKKQIRRTRIRLVIDNAFPSFGGNERTFSGSETTFIFVARSMDLAFGHEDHFCK